MDYRKIYSQLIDRASNRELDDEYYETHHIIPRCLGGDDSSANLVNLTPEEHYLAHQLLAKIYDNHKLLSAAIMMTAKRNTNKIYGWLRRRWSDKMKNNNPNHGGESRRQYNSVHGSPNRGYKHTEDNREKFRRLKLADKNPNYGVDPWNHPRATDETKKIWADAKWYYETWKSTRWGYYKLAKARGFDKPLMTHNNMVKRFKSGWIPE